MRYITGILVAFAIILATVVSSVTSSEYKSEDATLETSAPIFVPEYSIAHDEIGYASLDETIHIVLNQTEQVEETEESYEFVPKYEVPLSEELQNKIVYYMDYMNIELDESYIYALIYKESRFNPKATGRSGDIGYCQILLKYFDYIYGKFSKDYPELVRDEEFVYDIYNEKTNLACGIYWLSNCAKEMSGDPLSRSNLTMALTAYNRGTNGAKSYFNKNNTYVTEYSSSIIDIAEYIQNHKTIPNL